MSNRMGRPTESTKDFVIKARVNEDTKAKLEACIEISKIFKSDMICEGIYKMYYKLRRKEK